ncbi:MAG: tRNA-dihydrouridine synthase family protein [Chlamydiales bacterium]|nr:tRNA-dihydrouridine synthase family protein [Chlamydiales bacterium]
MHPNSYGCPPLFLAPMEGVGDRAFRKAMATIGGFDQACTEFIRVPCNAHVKSLAKVYEHNLTTPILQAAQLMGDDPELMAAMAVEIELRQAPRIDLNCGCPSNTVTGKGAGSSLLKNPEHLYKVARAMVKAVSIPVTAKLRSGFHDTSLFKENLLAAQESGIKFLTLHPRTKEDGYRAPAKWELIAKAKSLLKIPVVGNGDILSVKCALDMLKMTSCDALMIGRGAVINPLIFHEIKCYFAKSDMTASFDLIENFIGTFVTNFSEDLTERGRMNKLKQLFGFLFQKNKSLQEQRQVMLTNVYLSANDILQRNLPILQKLFQTN